MRRWEGRSQQPGGRERRGHTPAPSGGAPPTPTPARHTGCKLQDAEGRRSESWSRGTATAAERESRAGLPPPQQALGSSPAQPRVPRGHHTQYVGRRMAEREAECVNKVFQAQTGKSTIDELDHSENRSSAAPVHPCSRTALKPRFLTSPGSEGTARPVRTPAAGARAPRRPGGHGGP